MRVSIEDRPLDDWYYSVNRIYLDRNFYRDRFSIFAHLVEVLGGLSLLASSKRKPDVTPERYVPKAIAWWMALCGKVGIRSVESMLWAKFPSVCTYCHRCPHHNDSCLERKAALGGADWKALADLGVVSAPHRPRTLSQWQSMFSEIYPVSATEDYPATVGRFTEELGELAEALRVAAVAPGYFLSEASDVFAWLMHLQNLIHTKRGLRSLDRGKDLEEWFAASYPDRCRDCRNPVCTCPPILPGTFGRIAHEIPPATGAFSQGGALLTQEEASRLFELGSRVVTLGGREIEATVDTISDLHKLVSDLKIIVVESRDLASVQIGHVVKSADAIEELASAQRLTQASIDTLAEAIAALPSEGRNTLVSFLTGLGSSVWATALLEQVRLLIG